MYKMTFGHKINSAPVLNKVYNEEKRRVDAATRFIAGEVKKALSIKVGKNGKRVTVRSKDGEAPRLETGELRRSITSQVEVNGWRVVGKVGTATKYAFWLESPEHLNRPFLSSTLHRNRRAVNRILIGQKIQ